jgi:cytosine/adenosine deaminase-related metal-dependent hydrolase
MRFIYSAFYSAEDVYLGNHVGALEALNAGITTLIDHSHIMNSPDHADEAVRGLKEAGIRGIFCYGFFPNPERETLSFSWDPKWRFDDARRVRKQHFSSDHDLLTLGLAPMEVTATPFDVTCSEIRFAREIGAKRISCHVSMGKWDRGERVVERLGEAGLLAEDLLFVHGSTLTDRELDLIADSGAGISSTPETELQMGMGQPVAVRALRKSAPTSLGIDIVSNFSGDMHAQMRLLLQSQRGFEHAELTAPPREIRFKAREVLELATLGGARVAGLASITGSLTPGKQADVVLTRCDRINMVPMIDPVGAVVLNANIHDVDTVLVAGRVVKRDGKLVGLDWASLSDRLLRSSERIVSGFSTVPLEQVEAMIAPLMLGSS